MKERLIKLMQAEHLTAARLADITNVQPSTVSHIIAGRNNPRYDFLAAILKNFPNVNSRWLLLGEGDIYEENGNKESNQERSVVMPQEQTKRSEPRAEMPIQQEPELDLAPTTGSVTEPHNQPIAIQEPHNQMFMQPEPRNQPPAMQSRSNNQPVAQPEPHNQSIATQEPHNQHIIHSEQSNMSLGVDNMHITSELPRQSEVKTPLPEPKKAVKIVIFNTDGTFEIYQN